MTLDEARTHLIECDAMVRRVDPTTWAMFVVTQRGHIQFSVNKPGCWAAFTFDIKHDDPDWAASFREGAARMREFCEAALLAKASDQKAPT